MNYFHNIAIVVPSCDKYSDMWKPLFENLNRQWTDNPLKIYLICNHADFSSTGVNVLKVGNDISWSHNLKQALLSIPEDIVFLLIDDLFFKNPINTVKVSHLLKRFQIENMNYLRFNPTPGPVGSLDEDGIGSVPPGDHYRFSTVICLWKKQVLIEVLRDDESAWDFELIGSTRTDQFGNWFASSQWLAPTSNLVIKGKIEPFIYWDLKKKGLPISSNRPLMSLTEYFLSLILRLRAWLFTFIPRPMRRSIREKFINNK